jgi:hypothetical protein
MLWDRIFYEGEFIVNEPQYGQQGWLWPWCQFIEYNHNRYYQIDIQVFDDPFPQEACNIYWLVIDMPFDQESIVGWKTTYEDLHFMDYAVWEPESGIWQPICEPVDFAFVITGTEPCYPGIDVEKQVQNPDTGAWVDADTPSDALDLEICTDADFKITIHNNGECCDLTNIIVKDKMHDSLEYKYADPEPDNYYYEPPYHHMEWTFPGPLQPCNTIEIDITAHVEGPDCTTDYNYVLVTAESGCTPPIVSDDDYAYVHAYEKSRTVNTPLLNWLQSYLNMFPLLQKLLQQFALF